MLRANFLQTERRSSEATRARTLRQALAQVFLIDLRTVFVVIGLMIFSFFRGYESIETISGALVQNTGFKFLSGRLRAVGAPE